MDEDFFHLKLNDGSENNMGYRVASPDGKFRESKKMPPTPPERQLNDEGRMPPPPPEDLN